MVLKQIPVGLSSPPPPQNQRVMKWRIKRVQNTEDKKSKYENILRVRKREN
jgi:hypothetical protein